MILNKINNLLFLLYLIIYFLAFFQASSKVKAHLDELYCEIKIIFIFNFRKV
jgi:hypothetical protein